MRRECSGTGRLADHWEAGAFPHQIMPALTGPGHGSIAGVVTMKDSGIQGWEDLAGETVSVDALKSQGDLTVRKEAAQNLTMEQLSGEIRKEQIEGVPFSRVPARRRRHAPGRAAAGR